MKENVKDLRHRLMTKAGIVGSVIAGLSFMTSMITPLGERIFAALGTGLILGVALTVPTILGNYALDRLEQGDQ